MIIPLSFNSETKMIASGDGYTVEVIDNLHVNETYVSPSEEIQMIKNHMYDPNDPNQHMGYTLNTPIDVIVIKVNNTDAETEDNNNGKYFSFSGIEIVGNNGEIYPAIRAEQIKEPKLSYFEQRGLKDGYSIGQLGGCNPTKVISNAIYAIRPI
jgi:hypothetical protein